ncbi:hypothetical protein M3Y98_00530500 [Aphelenchoides besseyi]|nr:hypothetical protein M3Y98_00530500 [Aphelenchoides besseyi]KAI6208036.1 hypothetical protein M3Y96_00072200 [Aphelenchoides besseyi]
MPIQEANDLNKTYEEENDENRPPLIDVQALTDHMVRVVGSLVGETNLDLIKDPLANTSTILEKFINNPQVQIFAVDQVVQYDDGSDEKSLIYTAFIELQHRKDRVMAIIFVKKNPMIFADTPIQN